MVKFIQEDKLHLGSASNTFFKAKNQKLISTCAEKMLWNAIRNKRLNGFKFRRQHPILRFVADFYCHEAKLIVEIDGEIHNEISNKEHDEGRTFELEEHGIKVIRFTNKEILNDLETVLLRINIEIQSLISLNK